MHFYNTTTTITKAIFLSIENKELKFIALFSQSNWLRRWEYNVNLITQVFIVCNLESCILKTPLAMAFGCMRKWLQGGHVKSTAFQVPLAGVRNKVTCFADETVVCHRLFYHPVLLMLMHWAVPEGFTLKKVAQLQFCHDGPSSYNEESLHS